MSLLLLLHGLSTTVDFTITRLGNYNLITALGALVPLAYLVSHYVTLLLKITSRYIIRRASF